MDVGLDLAWRSFTLTEAELGEANRAVFWQRINTPRIWIAAAILTCLGLMAGGVSNGSTGLLQAGGWCVAFALFWPLMMSRIMIPW